MKRIFLTIIAIFATFLSVEAQQGDSNYDMFRKEAVKLIAEGKLVEAKAKLEAIKIICSGAIPEDNDLDALIMKCIIISPNPQSLQFDSQNAKEQTIKVKINLGQFSANSNANWCRAVKISKDEIRVRCDDNPMPKERKAIVSIRVEMKTVLVSVVQAGGEAVLVVDPDRVDFPNGSSSEALFVYTNAFSWSVDSVPDWLETRIESDSLRLFSSPNGLARSRAETIYVVAGGKSVPVEVFQAGSDTLITTNTNKLVFSEKGSKQSFAVGSNLSGWQVEASNDWIRTWIIQDSVRVMALPNQSLFSRQGTVRISAGTKYTDVAIHQRAFVPDKPKLIPEINETIDTIVADGIRVTSFPDGLKVTAYSDDHAVALVNRTPFIMPIDYLHYTLEVGFEPKEAIMNDNQPDIAFEPGFRFATFTWSPKAAIGVMSGFVSANSWGAYTHFQANTPLVKDYAASERWLAGYNLTFGPVYQPRKFPYVGAYAGVGLGCYVMEPHVGFDYEAGLMGFYKNAMLNMGFHTSRMSSTVQTTSFVIGIGGYLKRYYDPEQPELGYCSSDSRRWVSVNYVFRPSEKGRGLMIGDLGQGKARAYLKGMYLQPVQDSITGKYLEAGVGVMFTPAGIIDLCAGASLTADLLEQNSVWYHGVGVELGAVVNIWRFPITVFLHEADLMGERHLCVDFGLGFHLGKFGIANSTYK